MVLNAMPNSNSASVADLDPGSGAFFWPLDPGSGMGKKSVIRIIKKLGDEIRHPGWKKVGSGINIPDKKVGAHLMLMVLSAMPTSSELLSCRHEWWSWLLKRFAIFTPIISVADPGSSVFWPQDPGSQMSFFRIPDPQPIFLRAWWQFLGKKYRNSLSIGSKNCRYRYLFKNKIIFSFEKFVATKKGKTTNYFSPLLFCCCCCWTRDPISGIDKNQDPGSGINIADTQHCL